MLTDGRRTTDAGVTGILIAHLGAFGSGELKMLVLHPEIRIYPELMHYIPVNNFSVILRCFRGFAL